MTIVAFTLLLSAESAHAISPEKVSSRHHVRVNITTPREGTRSSQDVRLSRRDRTRQTRERENAYFQERIESLENGVVYGHRLRRRQLEKELKRF